MCPSPPPHMEDKDASKPPPETAHKSRNERAFEAFMADETPLSAQDDRTLRDVLRYMGARSDLIHGTSLDLIAADSHGTELNRDCTSCIDLLLELTKNSHGEQTWLG